MVKLNWFEEIVIYIIVLVIMLFSVEKLGYDIDVTWFSLIFWIILYLIIIGIIMKIIKGKDIVEKPKQEKWFGKWWKKQKTYEKVLIISITIILIIWIWGLIPSNFLVNSDLAKIHTQLLEEEGYEVLYFTLFDGDGGAYVKMKSLGRRNEQVRSGLFSLHSAYPNAPEYTIRILEESQDCYYFMDGEVYRGDDRYNQINQMIESTSCS